MARDDRINFILATQDKTSADLKKVQQRLDRLEGQFKRTGKAARKMASTPRIVRFNQALQSTVTIASGLINVFRGAVRGFESLVSNGQQLADAMERTGASGKFLTTLRFQAAKTNTEFNKTTELINEMSLRITEAAQGEGQATNMLKKMNQAFGDINLSAKELAQLSPEEQFRRIAQAVARIDNISVRQNVVDKLFGGQGMDAQTFIVNFGRNMDQVFNSAMKSGAQLTSQQVQQLSDLNKQLQSLKIAALTQLQKVLAENSQQIKDGLQWLINNIPNAIRGIKEFADAIGNVAKNLGLVSRTAKEQLQVKQSNLLNQAEEQLNRIEEIDKRIKRLRKFERGELSTADVGGLTSVGLSAKDNIKALQREREQLKQKTRELKKQANGIDSQIKSLKQQKDKQTQVTKQVTKTTKERKQENKQLDQTSQKLDKVSQKQKTTNNQFSVLTQNEEELNKNLDEQKTKFNEVKTAGTGALRSIVGVFRDGKVEGREMLNLVTRLAERFGLLDKLGQSIGGMFSGGSAGGGGGFGLGGIGSAISSGLGAITSGIGSLFGGFFADGGTLGAGQYGIVGEEGPELIGPSSQSRTITPMDGGGSGVTINQTVVIEGEQDASVEQKIAAAAPAIAEQTKAKIAEEIQRGGKMAKVVGRRGD
jgi:hypothetical protein